MFEYNNLSGYDLKKDFVRFYNQIWYSKEDIINAIIEVKKWEYHSLAEDWELELYKRIIYEG